MSELDTIITHVTSLFGRCFGGVETAEQVIAGNRAFMAEFSHVGGEAPKLDPDTVVTPVNTGGLTGEWVRAKDADPDRRLFWIHGGGWISGAPADYRGLTETLSRETGASVFAIDYPLAPEHPFPAGLDSCEKGYLWLRDNGPDGSGPARSVWVAGDSAGGNLTLALLLKLRDAGLPLPLAAATLGANSDATASGESMQSEAGRDIMIAAKGVHFVARQYVQNGTPLTHPLVSPLFGELSGLPPLLMHVGEREVLKDDSTRFADKVTAAGGVARAKVWPGMIHVFEIFGHVLSDGRQSLKEIGEFFLDMEKTGKQ